MYLNRIKEVHLLRTGVVLDDEEALFLFENLMVLVENIYQPKKLAQKLIYERRKRDGQSS